jgi:hypothetical protein
MAVAEFSGDVFDDEQISVRMPGPDSQHGPPIYAPDASYWPLQSETTPEGQTTTRSGSQTNDHSTTPVSRSSQLVFEDGSNGTQAGVDFVLALERICLHHHKLTSPELIMLGNLGTGHASMLSSPVMDRVPTAITNPRHIPLQSGCRWTVPAAELERLLSLSQSLNLDAEATPVQIWQRVYLHPQFPELTFDRLDRLRCGLLPQVKCYG